MSAVVLPRALAWVLALLCCAPLYAGSVLVVRGPNSAPYREALEGFRDAFPNAIETERRDLPRRLRSDSPSLIVAIGREAAETAREQGGDIPVLFALVADPAAAGLTGRNVAGISTQIRGDVQLARFKELLPGKTRIAVIHNPASSGSMVKEADAAAGRLGLHLEDVPVNSASEVKDRFNFVRPVVEVIWVIPDEEVATLKSVWQFLTDQSNRANLPLLFTNGEQAVANGALAALMPDYRATGRQCGQLAQQIATGRATVDQIGIQSAQTARWAVNTRTARKIGVAIPTAILESARTYP